MSEVSFETEIPKRIFCFWHDHDCIPPQIKKKLRNTYEAHENQCDILFADDKYIVKLLSNEKNLLWLDLYQANRIPASRADMARLAMVYYLGGIYIDASMGFHKSVFDIIKPESELVLLKRDDVDKSGRRIANGIIGAKKGSFFIRDVMESVTDNLVTKRYNYNVWKATGPYNISIVSDENLATQENITYLSMTTIMTSYMDYFRNRKNMPKIVNTWVDQQSKGIFRI